MVVKRLHLPPIHREKRTTAIIRLLMATTRQQRASTVTIRRTVLRPFPRVVYDTIKCGRRHAVLQRIRIRNPACF
jgi:hypothetical protein